MMMIWSLTLALFEESTTDWLLCVGKWMSEQEIDFRHSLCHPTTAPLSLSMVLKHSTVNFGLPYPVFCSQSQVHFSHWRHKSLKMANVTETGANGSFVWDYFQWRFFCAVVGINGSRAVYLGFTQNKQLSSYWGDMSFSAAVWITDVFLIAFNTLKVYGTEEQTIVYQDLATHIILESNFYWFGSFHGY